MKIISFNKNKKKQPGGGGTCLLIPALNLLSLDAQFIESTCRTKPFICVVGIIFSMLYSREKGSKKIPAVKMLYLVLTSFKPY